MSLRALSYQGVAISILSLSFLRKQESTVNHKLKTFNLCFKLAYSLL